LIAMSYPEFSEVDEQVAFDVAAATGCCGHD
jgi:hypothetical protein